MKNPTPNTPNAFSETTLRYFNKHRPQNKSFRFMKTSSSFSKYEFLTLAAKHESAKE